MRIILDINTVLVVGRIPIRTVVVVVVVGGWMQLRRMKMMMSRRNLRKRIFNDPTCIARTIEHDLDIDQFQHLSKFSHAQ